MTSRTRRRVGENKLRLTPRFAGKCNITRLESFEHVRNAIEREKQSKAWTRAKRIALIESTNPKWNDLSRESGISRRPFVSSPRSRKARWL
jgi:putative endonuclease